MDGSGVRVKDWDILQYVSIKSLGEAIVDRLVNL
jgi:hypothetical protein